MNRSRKLLLGAAICGASALSFMTAHATDIDVTATLTASAAVTVANNANMDFGGLDFANLHSGTLQLGPDGNAALTGDTALTVTGSAANGELAVTSSTGTIDVTCDATGTISDGAGGGADLTIASVVWDVTQTTFGAASNTCGGLGTGAVSLDTGASNDPTLYIGASLTITSNDLNGSSGSTAFNTANTGGDPITFRLVFQ